MKRLRFLIILIVFSSNHLRAQSDPEQGSFPESFVSGLLNWGIDCENIKLNNDFTFEYKFSGDCKGWGRVLKGKWSKEPGKILLSGKMTEGPSEEDAGCSGSYYEVYSKKKKRECIKKYKKRILENFGVYPAYFKVSGFIVLNEKSEAIVTLQSELINNEKSKTKNGFLSIDGDSFGTFNEL